MSYHSLMRRPPAASDLLREARVRAKLNQRQLAQRAGSTQSVVARIETGEVSPRWDTVVRLLRVAGFDLAAHLVPRPVVGSHMMRDVQRILQLSPEDRLREVGAIGRFVANARRV